MSTQDVDQREVGRAVAGAGVSARPRVPLREPFAMWPSRSPVGEQAYGEGETSGMRLSDAHGGGGGFGKPPTAPPMASEPSHGGHVHPARRARHARNVIGGLAALAIGAGVAIGYWALSAA